MTPSHRPPGAPARAPPSPRSRISRAQLLVAGGPPAISLRAIARDMGMTAAALYRYFPSLDALVAELVEDLLRRAARGDRGRPRRLRRPTSRCRAWPRWPGRSGAGRVAHPAEFGLMFGNPVPGVARFEDDCVDPDHAGARFGAPFLEAFAEVWQTAPLPDPAGRAASRRSSARYIAPARRCRTRSGLPVEVVYAYLSGWTRLYGARGDGGLRPPAAGRSPTWSRCSSWSWPPSWPRCPPLRAGSP